MALEGIIDWDRPKVFRLKEALERFASGATGSKELQTRSMARYLVRRLKERLEMLELC